MTAHLFMLAGEALLTVSLAIFLFALVERARERRTVKIVLREQANRYPHKFPR